MNAFCKDRDLLAAERAIFLTAGGPGQPLLTGTGGACAGTTFTAEGCNFEAAGVAPGMVLCLYGPSATPAEGIACEIVSVDSAATLTVSLLRAHEQQPAIAPPPADHLSFAVRTFAPQIQAVCDALGEKLRRLSDAQGLRAERFADSAQLRQAAVAGTLEAVFVARAENGIAGDAHWTKAQYYRREFRERQTQLRLAVDADGDGVAEQTRSLGNVTLRRA